MKHWISLILLAAGCLTIGAAATALAEGKGKFILDRLNAFRAPPPPPPTGRAEDRAGDHLADAYDTLTLVGLCESKENGKQTSQLLDSSREFYRTAHKAYKAGDFERADETALAANDSARGILYTLKADVGTQGGLPLPPVMTPMGPPPPPPGDRNAPPPPFGDRPPPPPGDRDGPPPPPGGPGHSLQPVAAAKEMIGHAIDRLQDAPSDIKGPGRAFLDAAHKWLDEAKQAQKDGDSFKAVELARAAEAWSHVEEHLHRAEGPDGDRPSRQERKRAELKRQPPMPPSAD